MPDGMFRAAAWKRFYASLQAMAQSGMTFA